MKTILNKLTVPFLMFLGFNLIGFCYHKNYEGAVAGSLVGMLVAILVLEVKVKLN